MSRGPVSDTAGREALGLAQRRGMVIPLRPGRDCPCSFQIVSRSGSVFVTVKLSRQFHGSPADMEAQYREAVFRLRLIPAGPQVRRELWVRSRYGRWRFFEVTETEIVEMAIPA